MCRIVRDGNWLMFDIRLRILSGGALRLLLNDLIPVFEPARGITIEPQFGLTSALRNEIEAGAVFDLALLPRPDIDALVQAGRLAPGAVTDITRSAIGVAVREGAPKPDISSVEAFRRAVLTAGSLTYSDGPSGLYVASLLRRLGIAEAMRPKTKLATGPVAELIARGEAELGIQQIVAILPVKGADLVGPLPDALQNIIVYAAGLSPHAAEPAAARAFVDFLGSPEVKVMIRERGLEPG